ncbi:MAG: RNA polymerase sigma24 factor [Candidatus Hydrogenedentota bacterium]
MKALPAMSHDSDWDLIARAQGGDLNAFEALVKRYEHPLVNFCQRMVGSQEDAQDIAQESFVRVYRYLDRLHPQAKFSTVLFGMARNLTLNFLRDQRRRGRDRLQSLVRDDDTERLVADEAYRPDRATHLRELEALIQSALAQLTPEHREVLVLRELHGMDYEAVAGIVGCRKGTVKSRLARAREQLRIRLLEMGGELP